MIMNLNCFYYVGKVVGKKVNKRDNHLKTGQ